jgi:hypothetical protein
MVDGFSFRAESFRQMAVSLFPDPVQFLSLRRALFQIPHQGLQYRFRVAVLRQAAPTRLVALIFTSYI